MPVDQDRLEDILGRCGNQAQRKDAHVIMTAVVAEAATIVTLNPDDFAPDVLAHFNLRKESPDEFLARLFPTMTNEFIAGARAQRQRLKAPPYEAAAFLAHIAGIGFPKSAGLLTPHLSRI